jgi:8-oxo-dGTP pyrophosphatase MutT (NUDIX family)
MWNIFAFPKWIYHVEPFEFGFIFEMPILGYGGYLPFGLEVFALYHFGAGIVGYRMRDYVQFDGEPDGLGAGDRVAALIQRGDDILLIARQKGGQSYYVLPGGTVEAGESAEEALAREIEEETGLRLTGLEAFWDYHNPNNGRREGYFLAHTNGDGVRLGGPEAIRQSANDRYALEWVSLARLPQLRLLPQPAAAMISQRLRPAAH